MVDQFIVFIELPKFVSCDEVSSLVVSPDENGVNFLDFFIKSIIRNRTRRSTEGHISVKLPVFFASENYDESIRWPFVDRVDPVQVRRKTVPKLVDLLRVIVQNPPVGSNAPKPRSFEEKEFSPDEADGVEFGVADVVRVSGVEHHWRPQSRNRKID